MLPGPVARWGGHTGRAQEALVIEHQLRIHMLQRVQVAAPGTLQTARPEIGEVVAVAPDVLPSAPCVTRCGTASPTHQGRCTRSCMTSPAWPVATASRNPCRRSGTSYQSCHSMERCGCASVNGAVYWRKYDSHSSGTRRPLRLRNVPGWGLAAGSGGGTGRSESWGA